MEATVALETKSIWEDYSYKPNLTGVWFIRAGAVVSQFVFGCLNRLLGLHTWSRTTYLTMCFLLIILICFGSTQPFLKDMALQSSSVRFVKHLPNGAWHPTRPKKINHPSCLGSKQVTKSSYVLPPPDTVYHTNSPTGLLLSCTVFLSEQIRVPLIMLSLWTCVLSNNSI